MDHRYQGVLIEVIRIVVDMYSGIMGALSKKIDTMIFKDLSNTVD